MALPRDGLEGCEKEKLQMHIALHHARPLTSPLAAPTPEKGLHEHGAPSRSLMLFLHGAAPIAIPWATLGRAEEAGFLLFPWAGKKIDGV